MYPLVWFAAAVGIVLAGWYLHRRFRSDGIETLMARRSGTSRFVSRGSLVEDGRHQDVALAIDRSTLFYENRDKRESIELRWVLQVEYDTRLATGAATKGGKVLRLHSKSRMFEFVLPNDVVARWHTMLPQRRTVTDSF